MKRRRKNREESVGEELVKEDAFASLVRKWWCLECFMAYRCLRENCNTEREREEVAKQLQSVLFSKFALHSCWEEISAKSKRKF